jgi:hypothetical protein
VNPVATRQPLLADPRTLEVLDFAAIRELLARETMTDRAAARSRALEFLSADELRGVAIALAAAEAAVRRVRDADAPVLRSRVAGVVAPAGVVSRIDHAIGERGEVLDRATPALGRIRRNVAQANEEARDRAQAILRSPAFAKAIQDAIVTCARAASSCRSRPSSPGTVPGVVHDTSASGQTLFVEPLAALEVNNRVRTLRIEEEREVARVLAELSGARRREREAGSRSTSRCCRHRPGAGARTRRRGDERRRPEISTRRPSRSATAGTRCSASARSRSRIPRRRDALHRHQRPEHGRQDRHAEDARLVRRDGLLRFAPPGRRGDGDRLASSASAAISATSSRSRRTPRRSRRTCSVCADRRERAGRARARAHRRDRERHRARGGAALALRCWSVARQGCARRRYHACDRTEAVRARDQGGAQRERALRSRDLRARPTNSTSARPASRWHFRLARALGIDTRSSRAPSRCSRERARIRARARGAGHDPSTAAAAEQRVRSAQERAHRRQRFQENAAQACGRARARAARARRGAPTSAFRTRAARVRRSNSSAGPAVRSGPASSAKITPGQTCAPRARAWMTSTDELGLKTQPRPSAAGEAAPRVAVGDTVARTPRSAPRERSPTITVPHGARRDGLDEARSCRRSAVRVLVEAQH